jgi:hypothetical protein
MTVVCEKCGQPVRYIAAARSVSPDGIFVVNAEPQELINESGRIIKGFRQHKCPEEVKVDINADQERRR